MTWFLTDFHQMMRLCSGLIAPWTFSYPCQTKQVDTFGAWVGSIYALINL